MTRVPLDKELHDLDDQIISLGSLVDKALVQALETLCFTELLNELSESGYGLVESEDEEPVVA